MGAFEFVALDKSGKESKGLIEGDTPKHVRQLLRERNMFPVRVTEVAQREAKRQTTFSLRRGLSPGELALITRQMASLSQSGLPLEEVLLAVSQQNDHPRTKSILLGVRSKVMEGHTLADGLADFPQAFPELYRATVAAGEQSGHLDVVLETACRLHGGPPGTAPAHYQCNDLPGRADRHGAGHHQLHAGDGGAAHR